IHIGLVLQGDVALQLSEQLLLQLAQRLLTLQQVTDKEQRETTKAEVCDSQRPLVAFGMLEYQRVHEDGKSAGEDKDEDDGKHSDLEAATLQFFELLSIE